MKNHEKPTWNHENHENPPGTMKNRENPHKNHEKPWKPTWNQEFNRLMWQVCVTFCHHPLFSMTDDEWQSRSGPIVAELCWAEPEAWSGTLRIPQNVPARTVAIFGHHYCLTQKLDKRDETDSGHVVNVRACLEQWQQLRWQRERKVWWKHILQSFPLA